MSPFVRSHVDNFAYAIESLSLSMVGTTGSKFPDIRTHFQKNIGDVYRGLDLSFKGFPDENTRDPEACKFELQDL